MPFVRGLATNTIANIRSATVIQSLIPAKLRPYAKAVVAVIGAAVTVLLGVVPPHSTVFSVLTTISGLLTATGVYAVENKSVAKPAD